MGILDYAGGFNVQSLEYTRGQGKPQRAVGPPIHDEDGKPIDNGTAVILKKKGPIASL